MAHPATLEHRHWLAGAALLTALIWGTAIWLERRQIEERNARLEATRGTQVFSAARLEEDRPPVSGLEVRYGKLGTDHTLARVRYEVTPPVGGTHWPVWLNCGVYLTPVADENAVHALEHGAVWITHRPNLKATDLQGLHTLKTQARVILSPYPGQVAPVIATAWGVQLRLDRIDLERLKRFIASHRDHANAPEPNGPCTAGTGLPVTWLKEANP
jgi:Protein of unknown function (DUF3105)